ncbi:S24 family peptidase [Candidatus Gracilibacteria bacterium]|nr:S24 family peptidase [Candidatus Gracilibacteria bacterium]
MQIDIYESISAGFGAPAEEAARQRLSLESYIIEKPNTSVFVSVKGDSMQDAGIYSGDVVVVEKGGPVREDDIIVAEIDGSYTLKYYKKDSSGKIFLRPANSDLSDMYPREYLEIFGVVKTVIRKY